MIIERPLFDVSGKGKWVTVGIMDYYSHAFDISIIVPSNFSTDLASIPRYLQGIIQINGNHRLAAVVHDYLLVNKGVVSENEKLSREECDNIFYDLMIELGVKKWRAKVMFLGVRTNSVIKEITDPF